MLTELIIKASLPRKAIKLLSHRNKLGDISRNFSGRSNKLEASDPKKPSTVQIKLKRLVNICWRYTLSLKLITESSNDSVTSDWTKKRNEMWNKGMKGAIKNQERRKRKSNGKTRTWTEKTNYKWLWKNAKKKNSGLIHYKVYSWIIKPLKKPKRRNSCGKKEKRSAAAILFFLANLEANKGWTINAEIWWCKLT